MGEPEFIGMIIGRHKYNQLKSLSEVTEEQQAQINDYENKSKLKTMTKEKAKKIAEYYKKVCTPKEEPVYNFEPKELLELFFKVFKSTYKDNQGIPLEFIKSDDTKGNITPLIYYFTKDERFFKCKNVIGREFNFNGKIKQSIPSFDKGLLIIGNNGNGKSSTMFILHKIFSPFTNLKFRRHIANDVIDQYEACYTSEEKNQFWYIVNKGVAYYDDVKTERKASNYGTVNIFKDVIEKREVRDLKTHITCNFKESDPNDIEKALLEFGEKYGSRVFDRLFKMFNIVIFTGRSFRK